MIRTMKSLLLLGLLGPALALAAGGEAHLEHAPIDIRDAASLQRGARTFVNYCLTCHSAQYMRYNRLLALGLSEQQIRDNLMFGEGKIGDTMTVRSGGVTPNHSADCLGATGMAMTSPTLSPMNMRLSRICSSLRPRSARRL